MSTELGTISSLVHETVDETTPLEKRLNQLGHWLIWVSLGVAALVGATGIAAGRDVVLMIETGIALAVASIPEGLPIVATIALDRCARAHAWLSGKDYVAPSDIQAVVADIFRHRLLLSFEAEANGIDCDYVISKLLSYIAVP